MLGSWQVPGEQEKTYTLPGVYFSFPGVRGQLGSVLHACWLHWVHESGDADMGHLRQDSVLLVQGIVF